MSNIKIVPFDQEAQQAVDLLERYYPGFAVFMSDFAHGFEQKCREVIDSGTRSMFEMVVDRWGSTLDDNFMYDLFKQLLTGMMKRAVKNENIACVGEREIE